VVKVRENLSGKVFNRLTVIKQVDDYVKTNGKHIAKWLCKCQCGCFVEVTGESLKSGHTKSCGCLIKEVVSKIGK